MNFKMSRKSAIIAVCLLILYMIIYCSYITYQQFTKNNIISGWVLTIISTCAITFLCYIFYIAIKVSKPQPPKESP